MSSEECPLLYSIILGDGNITKKGSIVFAHSVKYLSYAEHKKKLMEDLGFKVRMIIPPRISGFSTVPTVSCYTSQTSLGKRLRNLFYPNNTSRKILPEGILDGFGWRELAILFQDDGRTNKISHTNNLIGGRKVRIETLPFTNRYEFCFPTFSVEEDTRFMDMLTRFGIQSRILRESSGQKRISITQARSKVIFYEGIMEHIHERMEYKLVRPALSYTSV